MDISNYEFRSTRVRWRGSKAYRGNKICQRWNQRNCCPWNDDLKSTRWTPDYNFRIIYLSAWISHYHYWGWKDSYKWHTSWMLNFQWTHSHRNKGWYRRGKQNVRESWIICRQYGENLIKVSCWRRNWRRKSGKSNNSSLFQKIKTIQASRQQLWSDYWNLVWRSWKGDDANWE